MEMNHHPSLLLHLLHRCYPSSPCNIKKMCHHWQPHNIQRLQHLGTNLVHTWRPATKERCNYLCNLWHSNDLSPSPSDSASSKMDMVRRFRRPSQRSSHHLFSVGIGSHAKYSLGRNLFISVLQVTDCNLSFYVDFMSLSSLSVRSGCASPCWSRTHLTEDEYSLQQHLHKVCSFVLGLIHKVYT